jgi:hypothetical protein
VTTPLNHSPQSSLWLWASSALALGIVCLVSVAWFTWTYTTKVPYYEEWFVAQAVLDHADGKGWPWGLMWAQDMEARHPFSYLYMLPAMVTSAMDFRWWTLGNVVLALVNSCLLARLLVGRWKSYATIAGSGIFMALTCTPMHFEAFLNGSYLHGRIATSAVLAALVLIVSASKQTLSERAILHWILASTTAVAATFSFTFGVFVWPLGLAALWIAHPNIGPFHRKLITMLWIVVAAVCAGIYLIGFQVPIASRTAPRAESFEILVFMLRLLGAPISLTVLGPHESAAPIAALIAGVVVFVCAIGAGIWALSNSERRERCLPALLVLGFGLMYTGATAASRAQFIVPFTSRYYTNVLMVYFATGALILSWCRGWMVSMESRRRLVIMTTSLILIAMICVNQFRLHTIEFANRFGYIEAAHQALRNDGDRKIIRRLSPDVDKIRAMYPRLMLLRHQHGESLH